MRVNVYAEEMTDRVEVISKVIDGQEFTGLRIYLELPATVDGVQHKAPFMHGPGDDDSSAVTFWGKRDLRRVLAKAVDELDRHVRAKQDADVDAGRIIPCPDCNSTGVFRFSPAKNCRCDGRAFIKP